MSVRPLISSARFVAGRGDSLARLSACPQRQFGSTPANAAVRVRFTPTRNEKLNADLDKIEKTLIFPAYLPKKQSELVFNPLKRAILAQNPVVLTVEGQDYTFPPLDRSKDIENSKKIYTRVLKRMWTPEHWANLGTLLAGYRKAGILLKHTHLAKAVRMAGSTGNIFAIIECAQHADQTGLTLVTPEITIKVFSYINAKIYKSGWEKSETLQAQKWATMVLDLLHRPPHSWSEEYGRNLLPFSRVVRGLLLFTRASVAKVKQAAGEAIDEDLVLLRDEVTTIRSLWEDSTLKNLSQEPTFGELNPELERQKSDEMSVSPKGLNGCAYTVCLTQMIKGMALTREILGDEAKRLERTEIALEKHLREFVPGAVGRCLGWAAEYEKIMGKAPNWPVKLTRKPKRREGKIDEGPKKYRRRKHRR